MAENTDQRKLMNVFGSLLSAKGDTSQDSQSSYYEARKQYERERLKTSILAPIIGGVLGDVISAPFRTPLNDFLSTEKGAGVYTNYQGHLNNWNKLEKRRNEIETSGKTVEDFYHDLHLDARESALKDQYGEDWRQNPLIFGTELGKYKDEVASMAEADVEEYNRGRAAYPSGVPDWEIYKARIQEFNPEASSMGDGLFRWIGRKIRGESKEEHVDRMINQITGGPSSVLGVDYKTMTDLVNSAILLDNKSVLAFKERAEAEWRRTVGVDRVLEYNMKEIDQEEHNLWASNYLGTTWRRENPEMAEAIRKVYSDDKQLTDANVYAELQSWKALPTLNSDQITDISTLMHLGDYDEELKKLRDNILENNPMLVDSETGEPIYTAGSEEENRIAGTLFNTSLDNIIRRAWSLAQRGLLTNEELAEAYKALDVYPEGDARTFEQTEFMKALVQQQLPAIFEYHMEVTIKPEKETGMLFWKNISAQEAIWSGRLKPTVNIPELAALRTEVAEGKEGEEGEEGDDKSTTLSGKPAEWRDLIEAGQASKVVTQMIDTLSEQLKERIEEEGDTASELFKLVNENTSRYIDILGGEVNPYIAPDIGQGTPEYNRLREGVKGAGIPLAPAYSITAFPFRAAEERIELPDEDILYATLTEQDGQYNFRRYIIQDAEPGDILNLYDPAVTQTTEMRGTGAGRIISFEDLPDGPFKYNAMWASKVYQDNERRMIGSDDDVLKEKLSKANVAILQKFDFSGLVGVTGQDRVKGFLEDAYEAYKGLGLEEEKQVTTGEDWTEGQIDEAGNIMPPPSLLEPEDDSQFAPEVIQAFDLLNEVGQQVIGNAVRPEVIAGIMGNIDVETGSTFDYQQKQKGGDDYGLFQFSLKGGKKAAYDKWLEDNNKDDSAVSQIEFVYDTIYGDEQDLIGTPTSQKLREVFDTGSVEEITEAFSNLWERPGTPHLDRRIEAANRFYTFFNP